MKPINFRFYIYPKSGEPHINTHNGKNIFPEGWDEKRVLKLLAYYERQCEEKAVAEDEAAFEDKTQTFMEVPNELVPEIRELIAHYQYGNKKIHLLAR